tara:strand:+ start:99 stop:386 length:288 start_codon:yes stop_codon:yes gene_type:complete
MKIDILKRAWDIVNQEDPEKNKYGSFEENFEDAAKVASILTNEKITAKIAIAVLVGLKIARLRKGYHEDSYLDLVAYIGAMEKMEFNNFKDLYDE